MNRFVALLPLVLVLGACSTNQDATKLVEEADAMLVDGGIENPKNREIAEQNYDRAIRLVCGEENLLCKGSGSAAQKGSQAWILSHAHFGLAFARTFDLVDRLRQLYVSDVIYQQPAVQPVEGTDADGVNDSASGEANQCAQQLNLAQLVPLLRTIVNTSLLPIVVDLQEVGRYSDFEITYRKAFLNFSFLKPGLDKQAQNDLTRRDIGIYFGADENETFGPSTLGLPEVNLLLAGIRLATMAAEGVFSFNDLTQALIVFLPKLNLSATTSPYTWARILNSDPCASNPLFNASFGVLTEQGQAAYTDVRRQLAAFFSEQQVSFARLPSRAGTDYLLEYNGSGQAWGQNLFKRVRTGDEAQDRSFANIAAILTQLVSPSDAEALFKQLSESLAGSVVFDLAMYIEARPGLDDALRMASFDARKFGVPALKLSQLFDVPVADLKSIAPLTYSQGEPTGFTANTGWKQVLGQEKPPGTQKLNLYWQDVNGDLHWNARGDFIIQIEREAFYDDANNNNPSAANYRATGILGTFWDADFNGLPDAGFEGVMPGIGTNMVTATTYDPSVTPPVIVLGSLPLSPTAPSENEMYRDYFDRVRDKTTNTTYGCLAYGPPNFFGAVCNVRVGDVLGHVWPNLAPEPYVAPSLADDRRRDPANGVEDRVYLFFPNPSLNGALLRIPLDKASGKYVPLANQDLNRVLNSLLTLDMLAKDLQDLHR